MTTHPAIDAAPAPAAAGTLPPVFILGAPRSGTSLLYKALCLHPGTGYISNWVRRMPSVPSLAALNRVADRWPERRRAVWFGEDGANAYVYAGRRGAAEKLFPMPVEGEPVFRRCGVPEHPHSGGAVAPPLDAAQRARLGRSFERLRRASGARVVVNKRIANNWRVPLLLNVFPDARFIVLTRDGRAVASSLAKVDWWPEHHMAWYGGTPVEWARAGNDPMDACALQWVHELRWLEEGLRAVPLSQQLHLRYEELSADPLTALDGVADFAGLPPDPRWADDLRALRYPDRNGAAWRRLEPSTLARIEALQHDELTANGYLDGGTT